MEADRLGWGGVGEGEEGRLGRIGLGRVGMGWDEMGRDQMEKGERVDMEDLTNLCCPPLDDAATV